MDDKLHPTVNLAWYYVYMSILQSIYVSKRTQGVWSSTRYTTHCSMCFVIRCNEILARFIILYRPSTSSLCGGQSRSVIAGPRHWIGFSLIDTFQKYVLCKFVWHFSFRLKYLRNEIKSLGYWRGVWYVFRVYVVDINCDQYLSQDKAWGMDSNMVRNGCWESVAVHWPIKVKVPCSFKMQLMLTGSVNFEYEMSNRHEGLECEKATPSSSNMQTVVSNSSEIYHHTGIKWLTQVPKTQPVKIIISWWYIFEAGGPYYI